MGLVGKRGGSWNNNPRNCRSAYRNNNNPDNRNNNIGFRIVCRAPFASASPQEKYSFVPELAGGNLSGVF